MLILTRGSICAFWDPALHQTAVQNRCPHSSSSCPVVRAACGQGGPRKAAHGGRCCGSPEELHLLVGFFLCASGSGPTFFFFFVSPDFFFIFFPALPSCVRFFCCRPVIQHRKWEWASVHLARAIREMLGKSSETHHSLNITTVPKAYRLESLPIRIWEQQEKENLAGSPPTSFQC